MDEGKAQYYDNSSPLATPIKPRRFGKIFLPNSQGQPRIAQRELRE